MNDDLVLFARSMPPRLSEIRSTRRRVRTSLLEAGIDGVGEQGRREAVRVELRRRGTMVTLTVANRAGRDELPPVDVWPGLPDAASARGRGLPVVAALSERVDVERRSDLTSITCWWTVGSD